MKAAHLATVCRRWLLHGAAVFSWGVLRIFLRTSAAILVCEPRVWQVIFDARVKVLCVHALRIRALDSLTRQLLLHLTKYLHLFP